VEGRGGGSGGPRPARGRKARRGVDGERIRGARRNEAAGTVEARPSAGQRDGAGARAAGGSAPQAPRPLAESRRGGATSPARGTVSGGCSCLGPTQGREGSGGRRERPRSTRRGGNRYSTVTVLGQIPRLCRRKSASLTRRTCGGESLNPGRLCPNSWVGHG